MSNLSKENNSDLCSHDTDILNGAHHVLDLDEEERPIMRTVSYKAVKCLNITHLGLRFFYLFLAAWSYFGTLDYVTVTQGV